MSLRLEMLQVARLAPKLLGESTELVGRFLGGQQNSDGGFKDRKSESDLYYTAFALDALAALQWELPVAPVTDYLSSSPAVEQLDFVHLCCLARCCAGIKQRLNNNSAERTNAILSRLESFRSRNGGFNIFQRSETGTAYGAFLGLGAYQDLGCPIPDPDALIDSVQALRRPAGGWANDSNVSVSSTNATAAAVTLLRNLHQTVDAATGDWLLKQAHPEGGFRAAPRAPIPDLLSTATALHALAALELDFDSIKERSLDFIDTLWTNEGSFYGHWGEDILDCEYTFYALLALGHLSL
jgi:prenyltransferase beta subunit